MKEMYHSFNGAQVFERRSWAWLSHKFPNLGQDSGQFLNPKKKCWCGCRPINTCPTRDGIPASAILKEIERWSNQSLPHPVFADCLQNNPKNSGLNSSFPRGFRNDSSAERSKNAWRARAFLYSWKIASLTNCPHFAKSNYACRREAARATKSMQWIHGLASRDDGDTAYIFVMCELVFTVVDRGGRAILRVTPTLCFNLQRGK